MKYVGLYWAMMSASLRLLVGLPVHRMRNLGAVPVGSWKSFILSGMYECVRSVRPRSPLAVATPSM